MELPAPRASAFWHRALPAMYRVIQLMDGPIRWWWQVVGLGYRSFVDLRVMGRRSGRPRRTMLTLLDDHGRWVVGHPNGEVAWTRNLEAAGTADVAFRRGRVVTVRARRLEGPARDSAILATRQQPFPANLIYRLARAHIRAVGVFFALERIDAG